MVNHKIYEDKDKIIEIDGGLHQFIANLNKNEFRISEDEMKVIQQSVLNILHACKIEPQPISIIKNIPIIKYNAPVHLRPPHECFNGPLETLSTYFSLDDDCEEIAAEINRVFFKKDDILCYIFPHRIFDVKGFLVKFYKNKTIVLFFEYKDYNGNFFDIFG